MRLCVQATTNYQEWRIYSTNLCIHICKNIYTETLITLAVFSGAYKSPFNTSLYSFYYIFSSCPWLKFQKSTKISICITLQISNINKEMKALSLKHDLARGSEREWLKIISGSFLWWVTNQLFCVFLLRLWYVINYLHKTENICHRAEVRREQPLGLTIGSSLEGLLEEVFQTKDYIKLNTSWKPLGLSPLTQ